MGPAAAVAEMVGGARPQEDGGNSMTKVLLHSMTGVARNKASLLFMSLQRQKLDKSHGKGPGSILAWHKSYRTQ